MRRYLLIVAGLSLVFWLVSPALAQNGDGDSSGTANNQYAQDQYDDEDVNVIIKETIPKKPLPNTGGIPPLGVALLGVALVGAGASVVWHGIRQR